MAAEQVCRECGCTEDDGCLVDGGFGVVACSWREPDLCDGCALGITIRGPVEDRRYGRSTALKITQIEYRRLVNLGNYENETLATTATVDEQEDPAKVFALLREWTNEQLTKRWVENGGVEAPL